MATLLGYPLPAATTMRDFLDAFQVEGGPLWAAGPQTASLRNMGRRILRLLAFSAEEPLPGGGLSPITRETSTSQQGIALRVVVEYPGDA